MKKIIRVEAFEHYLECEIDNGDIFRFDMSYVLSSEGEMIQHLKDLSFFKKVFIELGAITWPNGYDIHADTVIADGELIKSAS
jgi:hypothetical protein